MEKPRKSNRAGSPSPPPKTPGHIPWHALPETFRTIASQNPGSVLLETAKQDGDHDRSLLFLHPLQELIARTPHDLDALLRHMDQHIAAGFFVAGFFSYECGEHFLGLPPRTTEGTDPQHPMAWFGVYPAPITFDHRTGSIHGDLPPATTTTPEVATIHTGGLRIARDDYDEAIAGIHRYLQAGHTYQVNFTDRIEGETDSSPLAVYRTLLAQQPVPFAAYLNAPSGPILSFSPELFFRTAQGRIEVRPMKGTWPRGVNLAEDHKAEQLFLHDEKNRSEHVMIVDLLRNDLGRICTFGSVQVDRLFHVERYNTLLQMTSTCSGQMQPGLRPSRILTHLFPSGSITGAPKRRTMQIIQELEHHPRGVYTGCIGYFAPSGEGCFNVAIRTVTIQGGRLTMGVGGGITADSKADEEFEECRLKAQFLTARRPPFSLIETMRCENGAIALLPLHRQRLSASARYFGIRYDEEALRSELQTIARTCGSGVSKVRLTLDEAGLWSITASPLAAMPWSGRILLAPQHTRSADPFLHHKTTHRDLYERTLAEAHRMGFDEVLFRNEHGCLTEGAISNLILQTGERWLTPDLASGVLPGIYRAHLAHLEERTLRIDDLAGADAIVYCNALRGIRPVHSIETPDGIILWKSR